MGIIKKVTKGTLAVGTMGASVAVEKGVKAATARGAANVVTGKTTVGEGLTAEEVAAGILFIGMSHDPGRNAEVTLFHDRVERIKQRSRLSVSSAHQDVEITPIKSVTSVQTRKDGFYTKVIVYAAGNEIEFRFRHDGAKIFREAIQELMLAGTPLAQPAQAVPAPAAHVDVEPDAAEQIKKLADLRDSGILTEEEFQAKKAELLARI